MKVLACYRSWKQKRNPPTKTFEAQKCSLFIRFARSCFSETQSFALLILILWQCMSEGLRERERTNNDNTGIGSKLLFAERLANKEGQTSLIFYCWIFLWRILNTENSLKQVNYFKGKGQAENPFDPLLPNRKSFEIHSNYYCTTLCDLRRDGFNSLLVIGGPSELFLSLTYENFATLICLTTEKLLCNQRLCKIIIKNANSRHSGAENAFP